MFRKIKELFLEEKELCLLFISFLVSFVVSMIAINFAPGYRTFSSPYFFKYCIIFSGIILITPLLFIKKIAYFYQVILYMLGIILGFFVSIFVHFLY